MEQPFRKYLLVALIVAALLLGGREAREQIIKFGCLPTGGSKPADSWMDACASDRIGDYSHSAIWFGTEPAATAAIDAAKVLFFGNSRLEFAVSRGGAAEWFAAKGIRFYVLAFGYVEQSGWAEKLVKKFHLHPKVIVFDTNNYFTGGQSLPAQEIEKDPEGELKTALATKSYMANAVTYCSYLPVFCGRTAAGYRADADGHAFALPADRLWFGKSDDGNFEITPPPPPDTSKYEAYLHNAEAVLEPVDIDPKCVVFTLVPNSEQDDSLARFIAQRLGANFIAPRIDGLRTVDHHHLNQPSAQIWTHAFLDAIQPVLNDCLG